ncbi:hypothetical protein L227DRAFT_617882 [Lentinus tigrinus ALCF2SS1-6]|uniref:Uncharacterized protein n=1 Tax=Lentinus tigrinus ALCF2SS1-6 TaxID=1328759 RepID=A0A5C2RN97_9APHY|nr:hypothetical protein L227DRAFT_617882 [Lentinus tigrinus ALCF2SS1-6]
MNDRTRYPYLGHGHDLTRQWTHAAWRRKPSKKATLNSVSERPESGRKASSEASFSSSDTAVPLEGTAISLNDDMMDVAFVKVVGAENYP